MIIRLMMADGVEVSYAGYRPMAVADKRRRKVVFPVCVGGMAVVHGAYVDGRFFKIAPAVLISTGITPCFTIPKRKKEPSA